MKLLYFCRHGESEHGAKNLVVGSTDSPLTEQGRAQAKSAGKSAKNLGIEYIIASPLLRAHETAKIIANEIHFPVHEIEVNSLTRERHFGELESQPYRIDLDLDGFTDVEAVDSVVDRARLLLKHLETLDANTILIVSHAGFGRALRHIYNPGIPVYGEGSERFENGKIVELQLAFEKNPQYQPSILRLLELQRLLEAYRSIKRMIHYADGSAENDIEHSYSLAITAWYLCQYFPELDRELVIRFALAHDFIEVHAGDTHIFADQEWLDSKHERERLALARLKREWPDFPELTQDIEAYESKETPEAAFVYALDKITPIMTIFINEGVTWQKENLSLSRLHENKRDKVAGSPVIEKYYKELYALLVKNQHLFGSE